MAAIDEACQCRRIVCVTPVHNRKALTLNCLRSLFESDLDGIELHAIVVDDGSTDGTSEAIRAEFPQVEIVKGDGTLWYSEGTNQGIQAALPHDPDYVLAYNDDSLFPKDCIQRLLQCARRYPQSVVGPVLLDWANPRQIMQVGAEWQIAYGGWRTWFRQTVDDLPSGAWPVEAIAGNCVLIPIAAIREAGLLNSRAMPNFADAEYTPRLRRLGWRLLLEPSARLLCQPNTPPSRLSDMRLRELRDALWDNRYSRHNLKSRLATTLGGAPSLVKGYMAFGVYVVRLALKGLGLAGAWPNDLTEPRLRDRVRPLDAAGVAEVSGSTVLYCWPYTAWGGVQVYLLNAMAVAREEGFRAVALVPETTPVELIRMIETYVDRVMFFPGEYDLAEAPTVRRRIERRWRTWKAAREIEAAILRCADRRTIVQIDVGPWSSYRLLSRILRRHTTIVTLHTALPRVSAWRALLWKRRFAKLLDRRNFRLCTANADMRKSLVPYVRSSRLDRVAISPSCFDGAEIAGARNASTTRREMEKQLGLPPSSFRIVVGAQFIERKGYRDLLVTLRLLREAGTPVDCLWIAPSAPSVEVAALLRSPEHAGLLTLLTHAQVGGSHVAYLETLAHLADAFAMPSHEEGLPLALIEAMALGLPCIATAINGIPEAIRHMRNGLLVKPGNPEQLAEAISLIKSAPALREALGNQARLDALATYERRTALAPTIHIYRELAAIHEPVCDQRAMR